MAVAGTCGVASAETALAAAFLGGHISVGAVLILHTSLVLALFAWLKTCWKRVPRPLMVLLLGTAGLGPIGAWGTFLQIVAYSLFRRSSRPFIEWYAQIFPAQQQSLSVRTYEAILAGATDIGRERSVTSFFDVLSVGSPEQQRALLVLIAEHYRPSFAPALQYALQHPDPAVRVLAATAANKISTRRAGRIEAVVGIETLMEEVRRLPTDVERMRQLALRLIEEADSGLLSSERSAKLTRHTLSVLTKSMELDPAHVETVLTIAKLLLRLERHREVLDWLDHYPDVRDEMPEGFSAYLESLFNLGRFAEIRERISNTRFSKVVNAMAPSEKLAAAIWR